MVLSLRVDKEPWDKFAERISESMAKIADQFVEAMKQACQKYDPKHDRKVLICGYMEEKDCFCVATETMESKYDLDDAVVEFEEKRGYQNHLQIQQDDDLIVFEVGDNEGFQTEIEGLSQLFDQLIHDKVNSLPACDYSSLNLVENTVTLCTNKIEIVDAYNLFDKILERKGYLTALNPDPPDGFDQLTHGGIIAQLDPTTIKLGALVLPQKNEQELPTCVLNFNMYSVEGRMLVSIIKNGPLFRIPLPYGIEAYKVFDEMCRSVLLSDYAEEVYMRIMTDLYQPMYNDSGGGTGIPLFERAHNKLTTISRTTSSTIGNIILLWILNNQRLKLN